MKKRNIGKGQGNAENGRKMRECTFVLILSSWPHFKLMMRRFSSLYLDFLTQCFPCLLLIRSMEVYCPLQIVDDYCSLHIVSAVSDGSPSNFSRGD